MRQPDLVSVIIPTYNYAHFVADAIESALAQTHRPIEVIVVDDGSTDDTAAVLGRFAGRIDAIRKPNGGLSSARNAGIRAARGASIAILDADDVWMPDKIERQLALLREHPGAGVIGCGAELVDGQGRVKEVRLFPAPSGDRRERLRGVLLRELWIGGSGSGALIPAAVLERVGLFDEALTAAEDWDMWLRIVAHHPAYNVPAPLVRIRQHHTGTFRNAQKMERNQWKVYEREIRQWPEDIDWRTRRRARALILRDSSRERAFAGSRWSAVRFCLQSLGAWPLDRSTWRLLAVSTLRAFTAFGASHPR
jgi:glycosyltransferase involved in cell wall biosynthesis